MCGIIGIIGSTWNHEALIHGRDAMANRGPDDFGAIELEVSDGSRLGLGHRRLSILDLSSAGHQPMVDQYTGNIIVFNGEIYNHLEIRTELTEQSWRSSSDTETILAAYRQWKDRFVEKTVGMYALAIWDNAKSELFLTRDRIGIKPLYYCESGSGFCFASEIKALIRAGFVKAEIDPAGFESYLAFGSVQEPLTILKNVKILPPGHWLIVGADGRIRRKHCYWDIHDCFQGHNHSINIQNIRRLIHQSVKDRLISDAPIGAFLSGGIDSSAVVAAMSSMSSSPPRTFCLDFAEGEYREGRFAEIVANKFNCRHQTIMVQPEDLLQRLDRAFDCMDQPTCDGINSYFVSEIAKQSGVTVALSGQGGDEVFAGYPSFRLIPKSLMLVGLPSLMKEIIKKALNAYPLLSARWSKVKDFLSDGPMDIYGAYAHQRGIFWDRLRNQLLIDRPILLKSSELLRLALPQEKLASDTINCVSQLELSCYLRNTLLRDLDVFSMAHSLEVRVPLLDHRLIQEVALVKGAEKINSRINKHLLVRAMQDDLPQEIVDRRKGIFWFPWENWMRDQLKITMEETFNSNKAICFFEEIGLKKEIVSSFWQRFLDKDPQITWLQIWSIYVLSRWFKSIKSDKP